MKLPWMAGMMGIVFTLSVTLHLTQISAEPAAHVTKVRVGTYDSRCIAIAYVRTEAFADRIATLRDQLKQAEARGDTKAVERFRKAGERRQWMVHRQGFGHAWVGEYLADHHAALAEIAKNKQLSMIVWSPDYLDPAVFEFVDVTDDVAALFHPDENTQRTMREIRKHPPAKTTDDFDD